MPRFSLHPAIVLLEDGIFLAQRVSFPLSGIRMRRMSGCPVELNAEHVEDFALQPVGGQMDADAVAGRAPSAIDGLHADPLVAGKTIQDVDQIEALGALG